MGFGHINCLTDPDRSIDRSSPPSLLPRRLLPLFRFSSLQLVQPTSGFRRTAASVLPQITNFHPTPPPLGPLRCFEMLTPASAARPPPLRLLLLFLSILFCLDGCPQSLLGLQMVHSLHFSYLTEMEPMANPPIPYTSPSSSPQPFIPLLAPSPLPPFANISLPRLSGSCALNFSSVETVIKTTALDCSAAFAPFLANVICCPQLQATLLILLGQYSKNTGFLALDATHGNHCLSDIQQILGNQGANSDLQNICTIHPSNLSASSCPVGDVNGFESVVDSSQLLAACKKVDSVNECCSQICQNAILEAARKLALRDGSLPNMDGGLLSEHSSKVKDCRSVVLRWLASRLDPLSAKKVFRRISNCNINNVCPLVFPDPKKVGKYCGTEIRNKTICCHAMTKYVSHLQKQSFITNLQALNCAALLGVQLQKINVSANVYSLCHITLKHFSVQVGSQESGCLLPSLPSDVTFDQSTGISFTCDLNDNIAAPWPSSSEVPSSCNNTKVKMPALPAATSANSGISGNSNKMLLLLLSLPIFLS